MFHELKRTLLYQSKSAIKERRLDRLYSKLSFSGQSQHFVKEDSLLDFFEAYLKALSAKSPQLLAGKVEPRFLAELAEFLKIAPPMTIKADPSRKRKPPRAFLNGFLTFEGVRLLREQNDYHFNYSISKEEDRVIFDAQARQPSKNSESQFSGQSEASGLPQGFFSRAADELQTNRERAFREEAD